MKNSKVSLGKLNTRDIALMGVMTAILETAVHVMAGLPNVEPVTLLIILYTLFFGPKVVYILAAYLLIEGFWYGFGVWWVAYVYIWPLLSLITYLLRRQKSVWVFAVLAGAFGLGFGALCSIPYFFIGGPASAFAWWVAGIPYDLIHCIANIVMCLVLFYPLNRILNRFRQPGRDWS